MEGSFHKWKGLTQVMQGPFANGEDPGYGVGTCMLCVERYIKEGRQKFNSAFYATKANPYLSNYIIFESSLDI
jgi:hypothetical protein